MQNLLLKTPIFEKFGEENCNFEHTACIENKRTGRYTLPVRLIFAIVSACSRNSQLWYRFAAVCRKNATFCPTYFLAHDVASSIYILQKHIAAS